MSQKILVGILVLAVLICASGFLFSNNAQPQLSKSAFEKLAESSVISSWVASAYGEVVSVGQNTVTLNSNGQTLEIPIKNDAQINLVTILEKPQEGVSVKTKSDPIRFSDITLGQKVSIMLSVKTDGTFEGTNVSVFKDFVSQ